MSGPLIFVATNRLRPGAFEAERERVPGLIQYLEANEPRLIGFNEYVNDDRTEVSVVQVHPDAESMEFHLAVVKERATRAFAETLEGTTRVQVFGTPSDRMLKSLREQAGSGFDLSVNTQHLGGFTRVAE